MSTSSATPAAATTGIASPAMPTRPASCSAIDCEAWCDTGAYSPWPWPAGIEASTAPGNIQGPYDVKAVRGRALTVATNKPPGQPYRGVARPGACFGHETLIDALARKLGRESRMNCGCTTWCVPSRCRTAPLRGSFSIAATIRPPCARRWR